MLDTALELVMWCMLMGAAFTVGSLIVFTLYDHYFKKGKRNGS